MSWIQRQPRSTRTLDQERVVQPLLHMTSETMIHFETVPEGPLWVGSGSVLVFSGYHSHRNSGLSKLSIEYCGQRYEVKYLNERRNDLRGLFPDSDDERQLFIGFWGVMAICTRPQPRYSGELTYYAHFNDGYFENGTLGRLEVVSADESINSDTHQTAGLEAKVAICMATYKPDRESFRRQINSIKNQTFRDWVCFISDDGSGVEYQSTIREFCGDDDRFKISFFNQNHGFYHNFERGLRSLEGKFDFVALSDQDDYWYPEKLQSLVDQMDDKSSLVYSDMRIVTDSGDLISETYWRNRKNNYQRLDVLMSANTVTGAATLFRAEMLEKILPFPKKIGDAFHDHWIAIVGITQGELKYIDAPLYDYYQHTENIIGHVDFDRSKRHTENPPDRSKRLSEKLSSAFAQGTGYLKKPKKNSRLKLIYLLLRAMYLHLRAFFRKIFGKIIQLKWIYLHQRAFFLEISVNQCRSLEVMSETIKLRDDRIKSNRKLSPLFAYGRGLMSTVKLLKGFFIAKMMGYTTANRDLYMALGYLFYSIDPVKLGYHFKQLLLKLNLTRNQ